ncbi:unnamed protein product, partial [Dovyalis caffra]
PSGVRWPPVPYIFGHGRLPNSKTFPNGHFLYGYEVLNLILDTLGIPVTVALVGCSSRVPNPTLGKVVGSHLPSRERQMEGMDA